MLQTSKLPGCKAFGSVVFEMPQTEAHDEHDGEFVSRVKQKPREAFRIVPNLKSRGKNSGEIWFKSSGDPSN